MNLVGLRYWQWIFIGLAVGALIGYAWTGAPPNAPTGITPDFCTRVRDAKARADSGQIALVRNIVVHPKTFNASGEEVYPVAYDIVPVRARGTAEFRSEILYAETPFREGTGRRAEHADIFTFLNKAGVSYSDRSGNGQFMPVGYGAAGGVLAIGLVWPTLIQLMVNAGLAKPPPPREKKVKKAKSSKITAENYGTDKTGPRGVTGADVDQLNDLNDDLESRLAAGLASGSGKSAPTPADEPVSVFMTGQGSHATSDPTATPAASAEPESPKDFKGEWYPVARPQAKQDQTH